MDHDHYDDAHIARILSESRVLAVIGASANPERPSFAVMRYLLARGYEVVPVNPGLAGQEILGQKAYARLADIPGVADIVDIFRRSEDALGVVREAIALKDRLGIKTIWMQQGIRNDVAAAEAEAAGLKVVMDRCPKVELARLAALSDAP
jgi:hypothetical protein